MARVEDKFVKIPAIVHATRIGYTYLSIKEKVPGVDWDADTNIFYDVFKRSLSRINNREIDEKEAKHLIAQLRDKLGGDDLGRAFFNCLQSGVEGTKLIDFENANNNSFNVVTELPCASGEDSYRPDITFLVNGMPLAFMEVKRQNNREGIQAERTRMTQRFSNALYKRFVNETQVMAFSNNQEYDDNDRHHLEGSFYASSAYGNLTYNHFREENEAEMLALLADRNDEVERFICKDSNLASFYGTEEFETEISPNTPANRIITSLFSCERILFLLRYGICYVEKVDDDGITHLQKHVMRYPQLFATKAVQQTLENGKKKGVIWHTQGSGKTALSFFLTRFLRDFYQKENKIARFFFIVDRLDLADQASNEFRSRGANVSIVNSREEFAKALRNAGDGTNVVSDERTPAITVVNIQKFAEDSVAETFDYDLNVQRVYFIDEAHRDYKRGGAFLTNLVTSDPCSVKFALTGTPLVDVKGGNATKEIFGDYIHKYFYDRSIADGYTLKLLREDVKTEFKVKMQEVLRDLQEVNKLVNLQDVFEHKSYVEPLCDYIIDDYQHSKIELDDDTIGAMIVASSSAQARLICKCLEEYEPDYECELVLHDEGSKEERRKICDSFKKNDSSIHILVVYNMLLTGFDAHRLKKLYLCRSIKAHNLLQALTRVNRPYNEMNYGYVVDFADITEEYDKTNRAYLAELTEELGDATKEYGSLFEDPEIIEADLAHIKDVLFSYSTENLAEFQNEVSAINDKATLYELKNALSRYKDLRNVAKMSGYEVLCDKFDLTRASEMLREVTNRIQMINNKEALALKDQSTGAINVLLSQIEFNFKKIGEDELKFADEFQEKLKSTYESFANNFDPKDPEYVNLLELLRKKFEKRDIEEMTSEEMIETTRELEELKKKIDDLNRRDAQLLKKYGGDVKFARVHKDALRTPPPLTNSQSELFEILKQVKTEADKTVMDNHNVLGNFDYFKNSMQRLVLSSCKQDGIRPTKSQVSHVAEFIAKEYVEERKKAA